jgi:hypothetical protein
MRVLWSTLFFSLGLAIGTVISDTGADQGASSDVPAGLRITANDASRVPATPDASPLQNPSSTPDVHRDLPAARCEHDPGNCAAGAAQTARG